MGGAWDKIATIWNELEIHRHGCVEIHRHGCVEMGEAWDKIATIWNELEKNINQNGKQRIKHPESNHTEIDEALLELIERFDKANTARQKATAEKKSKVEEELVQAQNMRNSSLKTFSETRKGKEIMQTKVHKKDS